MPRLQREQMLLIQGGTTEVPELLCYGRRSSAAPGMLGFPSSWNVVAQGSARRKRAAKSAVVLLAFSVSFIIPHPSYAAAEL